MPWINVINILHIPSNFLQIFLGKKVGTWGGGVRTDFNVWKGELLQEKEGRLETPKISPRYPKDIPKICPRYPKDIPKISPRYLGDLGDSGWFWVICVNNPHIPSKLPNDTICCQKVGTGTKRRPLKYRDKMSPLKNTTGTKCRAYEHPRPPSKQTSKRRFVPGQYMSWDKMSRDKMSPDRFNKINIGSICEYTALHWYHII